MEQRLKITNRLLLIIAIPLAFYIFHLLSFIFVPLVSSMFIALLFLPVKRKMKRWGVPNSIRVIVVILIMFLFGATVFLILDISSKEIIASKDVFLDAAEDRINNSSELLKTNLGIDLFENNMDDEANSKQQLLLTYAKPVLKFISSSVPQLFLTLFFVILWLGETVDFEKIMNNTLLKQRFSSVKTFMRIEQDILTFIRVKFLISLGTGIATGLTCYFFGTSFPIFWGVFAFVLNFIQMIGSLVAVILCSIFAYVEMDVSGTWFLFVGILVGLQILFGSILEPIYLGKSFKINIIVVLVTLMFWGFIWGVPGMILAVPLTVFIKIIMEQFEKTKPIAQLIE